MDDKMNDFSFTFSLTVQGKANAKGSEVVGEIVIKS